MGDAFGCLVIGNIGKLAVEKDLRASQRLAPTNYSILI